MKFTIKILPLIIFLALFASCSEDDGNDMNPITPDPPVATFEMNQTVEIASSVTIDGSASMGDGSLLYNWVVTDPNGQNVAISSTSNLITFEANVEGQYDISLTVEDNGGTVSETGIVTVVNPVFATADQMGRPAINTVFNFFGDAAAKNGFNQTTPEGGNADPASFKGILDALQGYIGLDPETYINALGLDNATTAQVLASDVLMSNKSFPTTYGPSSLSDVRVGENVLNGRGLNDDVIDVTLILTFAGNLTNLSDLQLGLISDNVNQNDVTHSDMFPYLAQAN